MLDTAQVLEFVKQHGPCIPRDIMKEMGADTFMIGAVLSQLKDQKLIRVSHTKIGGSPAYYVSGQEQKLAALYPYLHEKEKKAFDLLQRKKILRDTEQPPVMRVALRNIRDFAHALEVNLQDNREIFWKWYLTPLEQAEISIRGMLSKGNEKRPKPQSDAKEDDKERKSKYEKKQERQASLQSSDEPDDEFYAQVKKYLEKHNIKIIELDVIRKGSDIDLIVSIPSAVGSLTYFCKAKNKQRSNDRDLSAAYVQGEMKKLPVLFLMTGNLTKRAKKMLDKEFRNITVKEM